MEDNRFRGKFNDISDQELNFTKEDRTEVFKKSIAYRKVKSKKIIDSIQQDHPDYNCFINCWSLFIFIPSVNASWND